MSGQQIVEYYSNPDFALVIEVSEAHLNFECYSVTAWDTDSHERYYGDSMVSIEEAEPDFTGFIKFDGCSHYGFQPNVMLHICDEDDLENLHVMMKAAYDLGRRHIEGWIGDDL